MNNVYERLNTEYGVILMDPPYHAHTFDGTLAVIYNAGVKENGGVLSQSQGWLILAKALLGHGERAFTYFKENAPSMQNDKRRFAVSSLTATGSLPKERAAPMPDISTCIGSPERLPLSW